MLNYKFIPSSYTKKVLEYIHLAKELASERGYIWRESVNKGVDYYEVHEKTKKEVEEFDEIDKVEKKETKKRSREEMLALLI